MRQQCKQAQTTEPIPKTKNSTFTESSRAFFPNGDKCIYKIPKETAVKAATDVKNVHFAVNR